MTVTLGESVSFDIDTTLVELDGAMLLYNPGGVTFVGGLPRVEPSTMTVIAPDGTVRFTPFEFNLAVKEYPWHIRDDGEGAFTLFYIDDFTTTRAPTLESYSASGELIFEGSYQQRTATIDIGGTEIVSIIAESLVAAADLPDGGIVGVSGDSRAIDAGYSLTFYNADGSLGSNTPFPVTAAPASASAAGLPTFRVLMSGETVVVLHQYRKGTEADTANLDREIFMHTFDLSGTPILPETRITAGDLEMGGFGFGGGAFVAETLADGRIAIAYRVQKTGVADGVDPPITDDVNARHDVFLQIRNPDGSVAVAEQLVNSEFLPGSQSAIGIHDFQDGSFAVTFDTNFIDTGAGVFSNTGIIQQYDAEGRKLGPNQELLDRNEFAAQSVIQPDGVGLFGAFGRFDQIEISVGDPISGGDGGSGGGDSGATPGADDLTGTSGADTIDGLAGDDLLRGLEGDDILIGGAGDDTLVGGAGNDELNAGDGADRINGGDGDDLITGGSTSADRRDTVFSGTGNDSVNAGHGNDLVYGQDGDDVIAGGFGADELFGQNGDDVITGSAFSDLVFGGAGDDFVNGGFGFDRINGGTGADKFFHAAAAGHGSDWLQDYSAAEGDVLVFGGAGATAADFVVRFAHTATPAGERSGDDGVEEAFVNFRGQTLWALVDGGGQAQINLQIGADTFDLLA